MARSGHVKLKAGEISLQKNERGFHFLETRDLYGSGVTVHESTLAEYEALDIRVEMNPETFSRDVLPPLLGFMVLTRDQVREMLPMLQEYVENGRLPAPTSGKDN